MTDKNSPFGDSQSGGARTALGYEPLKSAESQSEQQQEED